MNGPALPRPPGRFKPPAADAGTCYEHTLMAEPSASMDVPVHDGGSAPKPPLRADQHPPSSRGSPDTGPPSRLNGKGRGELERDLAKVGGAKWLRRLGILVAIAAMIGLGALWRIKTAPKPPPKYVTAQVSKGDVIES